MPRSNIAFPFALLLFSLLAAASATAMPTAVAYGGGSVDTIVENEDYAGGMGRARQIADANTVEEIGKIKDVRELFARAQQVNAAINDLWTAQRLLERERGHEESVPIDDLVEGYRSFLVGLNCSFATSSAISLPRLNPIPASLISRAYSSPQSCSETKQAALQSKTGDGFDQELKREAKKEYESQIKRQEDYKKSSDKIAQLGKDLKQSRSAIDASISRKISHIDSVSTLPWIVLGICIFCLGIVYMVHRFDKSIQVEWISTGQATQFVTIILLLSIIAVLAVNDRLSENTLGTLLGGVAGYVLAQGVGRSTARQAERQLLAKR